MYYPILLFRNGILLIWSAKAFIKNHISIAIAIGVKILLRPFIAQKNIAIEAKK